MNKERAFDRKHIENMVHRDIWDELNLPPRVVLFLQMYGKFLLAGLLCLILGFLGWSFYGQYKERRQENGSALLAEALRQPAGPERTELLRQVGSEFDGTPAALWGRIQLAHDASAAGEIGEAIAGYESALKTLSADNPLTPLVRYSLARSYESRGEHDQALDHYRRLADTAGFEARGLVALARIHELQNRPAEAIKVYERLATLREQPDIEPGFVENKLAALRESMRAVD